MEEIKIKYHADIEHIKKIEQGDWIDLRAAEDVFIRVGEYKLISLGVSMELPDGYEAHVVPRSSTFKNFGIILVNGMGIIDNSYCGNDDIWKFPALCLKPKMTKKIYDSENEFTIGAVDGTMICKGDRICQFRIMKKQPEITFTEVEELTGKNRGGIGSTGRG